MAEQRPVRARHRRSLLRLGRRLVREGLQPAGRHQHDLINPIGALEDGRPIFAATPINATTRADLRYNVINSVQSPAESTYQNMTLQLTRRQYQGIGFDFAYTLGKSEDNAPITSTLSVQGRCGPRRHDQPRS